MLGHERFAGVPPTALVSCRVNPVARGGAGTKVGSLQQFVMADSDCEERGPSCHAGHTRRAPGVHHPARVGHPVLRLQDTVPGGHLPLHHRDAAAEVPHQLSRRGSPSSNDKGIYSRQLPIHDSLRSQEQLQPVLASLAQICSFLGRSAAYARNAIQPAPGPVHTGQAYKLQRRLIQEDSCK